MLKTKIISILFLDKVWEKSQIYSIIAFIVFVIFSNRSNSVKIATTFEMQGIMVPCDYCSA